MTPEKEWDLVRNERTPLLGIGASGALRLVLLFGSAAIALTLVLTPLAENLTRSQLASRDGLDFTSTGSIGKRSGYTIRRSVMQAPGEVCIIRNDGLRSGAC